MLNGKQLKSLSKNLHSSKFDPKRPIIADNFLIRENYHVKSKWRPFDFPTTDFITNTRKTFASRTKKHPPLLNSQTWEDPQVNLEALNLSPNAHIVTHANAGCNVIAYLSTAPLLIHAIDENSAQLAMLEMKSKAIKHLPDYDAVLHFLISNNQSDNLKRYQRHIRAHLSDNASGFWQYRNLFGRPRYQHFSKNASQYGVFGNYTELFHVITKLFGGNLSQIAHANSQTQQILAYEKFIAPVFKRPIFKLLAKNIPGHQLFSQWQEKLRRLACDFPIHENCYAQQFFGRQLQSSNQNALPLYLQKKNFTSIRQHIDRIRPHKTDLLSFLQQQPSTSIDAYILPSHLENQNSVYLLNLCEEITRTATPNAKLIFRSYQEKSLIADYLNNVFSSQWKTDTLKNQTYLKQDRSVIHQAFFLYEKTMA